MATQQQEIHKPPNAQEDEVTNLILKRVIGDPIGTLLIFSNQIEI
jgi:hypothetical protein